MLDQCCINQIYKHQNRESANLLGRYYPTIHSLCFPNQRMVRMAVTIDYRHYTQQDFGHNIFTTYFMQCFWGNITWIEHQPFESISLQRKVLIMSTYGFHSSPFLSEWENIVVEQSVGERSFHATGVNY